MVVVRCGAVRYCTVPADGADGVNLRRLLWLALVALGLPFLDHGNLYSNTINTIGSVQYNSRSMRQLQFQLHVAFYFRLPYQGTRLSGRPVSQTLRNMTGLQVKTPKSGCRHDMYLRFCRL